MVERWVGALLCSLLCLSGLNAFAGPVSNLEQDPAGGIYAFDRVDLSWSLDVSNADSLTVDFGDGSHVVLPGSATSLRHFFPGEGRFSVSITAWANGTADTESDIASIRVQRRMVPGLNVMFLHHSTGRNLIKDSGFRGKIDWHNEVANTDIRFWDHDYAYGNDFTGMILPDSTVYPHWIYGNEANNIQPEGYYDIFCQAPDFRDSLLARHDVIIFKNDHRTGNIESDSELQQHKNDYLEIREVLDQFPDKLFIMVAGPPRRPEKISREEADRAREFYNWLQSPQYMNGHSNIVFFDLFDLLANANDAEDGNMLRENYRRSDVWDDHPNDLANMIIGPVFASSVLRILDPDFYSSTSAAPWAPKAKISLFDAVPNPFNPATRIAWELDRPSQVSLRIYDVSGHLVQTLVSAQVQSEGSHEIMWRGLNDQGRVQPSGVYFYKLDTAGQTATKRMTLVR